MVCTCNKTQYGSKKDADEDIIRIQKKSTRPKVPIRSYYCRNGHCWHTTSQEFIYDPIRVITPEDIDKLQDEIKILKQENEDLKNSSRKEERIQARADQRVKLLTAQVSKLESSLKSLRKTNSELISRLVQLENRKP